MLIIPIIKMGRWDDGEMGKWGNGEMGRWGDGEMGRWGDGEIRCKQTQMTSTIS
ncbi:hypothetical protein LYNGBM3L_43930 [Moorena producens 3L]|uniref:Uncharacterized protein n=1 Tax=Moorena producens 3L TaxID=489825 RepID=F4XQC1_9CYAN|nr:hypothetical protein LYNGBM3L_43930 [Moorena producens 3L]